MERSFFIDGIQIFGEKMCRVTASDVQTIEIVQTNLLHIARHFSHLNESSRKALLRIKPGTSESAVTESMLDELLKTAGSKFNPKLQDLHNIVSHLLSYLKQHIKNGLETPWIEFASLPGKYYTEVHFTVTPQQKKELGLLPEEFVGTMGVVLITEKNKKFITKAKRGNAEEADNITLNIIKDVAPPETDTITVCLKKDPQSSAVNLTSIYTSDGTFSPLFPNVSQQSPEEFTYNKTWWQNYAFFK